MLQSQHFPRNFKDNFIVFTLRDTKSQNVKTPFKEEERGNSENDDYRHNFLKDIFFSAKRKSKKIEEVLSWIKFLDVWLVGLSLTGLGLMALEVFLLKIRIIKF